MTNLDCIMENLRGLGVVFRLEGARFTYSAPSALSEAHRTGIAVCRLSILEYLRTEAGLCIVCGMEAAKCPTCFYERADIKEPPIKKPHLYCLGCWRYGGWKKAFPAGMFEAQENG